MCTCTQVGVCVRVHVLEGLRSYDDDDDYYYYYYYCLLGCDAMKFGSW
jgi:hypothetical protein